MDFNFPLPPVFVKTIPSREGDLAPEHLSSASSLFNIFHRDRVNGFSDTSLVSDLSSRSHPVFINSDLDPENRIIYECEEAYPVDRLSPVCMGYFDHMEYEAAMASISAAEEMLNQHQTQSRLADPIDVLEPSLQHRRSTSISAFR